MDKDFGKKIDGYILEVIPKGYRTLGEIVFALNQRGDVKKSGPVTERWIRGRLQALRNRGDLSLTSKKFWSIRESGTSAATVQQGAQT